ncbi:MAG: ABC transporter permease [Nitrososphaerales archaeon]
MDSFWKSIMKEFLNSKSGRVGMAFIIIILILALYSIIAVPNNIYFKWNNPAAWAANPLHAPPTWVEYLGAKVSPSISNNFSGWQLKLLNAGSTNVFEYTASTSFTWNSATPPQDVIIDPVFIGSAIAGTITWTKPGLSSLQISISPIQSNTENDANSPIFKQAAAQYIFSQTHKYLASPTKTQVMEAFFDQNVSNIVSGVVDKGVYNVQFQVVSNSPMNMSASSSLGILGTSYGLMGTDSLGRPISLGILAGLPNAIELGVLTSVVAVLSGVIFGGISGYLGARKDGVMQWFTLVFLALPALPFLVTISYTTTLTLTGEALLIAFLSWPFYAIIARTVSLSIRSQTYVEADKAMGISSLRSFFTHFMPRLIPVSIAYTVLGIPAGIILAETLGFLGVQPPNLITWGQILDDAFGNQAALYGWWWWVSFPGLMIILTAIPFVLMGFALERVISPRVSNK